jgi:hypothetical protein
MLNGRSHGSGSASRRAKKAPASQRAHWRASEDFKPPKNLWIEKNPSVAFNSPDYYAEIFSSAIDQFNQ